MIIIIITRCQRVTAAAVFLFLSMLGNAMWFGVVAQPSVAGIDVFGLITVSWEEIAMAFIMNVVTFPFVFLITFLFKYSKPSKLRSNTIKRSLETEEENEKKSDDENNDDSTDDDSENNDDFDDDDKRNDDTISVKEEDTKSLVSTGKKLSNTNQVRWFVIYTYHLLF